MATSRGDKYRRTSCFTAGAVENAEVARLVVEHYAELSKLITDEVTAEVFQDTYCRITTREVKPDFVKQFRRLFYNTLKEQIKLSKTYANITQQYADNQ